MKDIPRFRTYGRMTREEYSRRGRMRKSEVRSYRLQALYTKETVAEQVTGDEGY